MKKLIFILSLFLTSGCETTKVVELPPESIPAEPVANQYEYRVVRITFYNPGEAGGYQKSTGGTLTNLRSCAVDPEIFPYGSLIYVPGFSELIAEDTGTDVKSKHASKLTALYAWSHSMIDLEAFERYSNYPVVDIFVADKKEYDRLCKITPLFMLIAIKL